MMRFLKLMAIHVAAVVLILAAPNSDALAAKQMVLVTGSTGGTYYALGGAIAAAWNKELKGISVSSVSSGASVENMNLLHMEEADLGLAMNSIADAAWQGQHPFPAKMNKFRSIGVVYPEVYQVVAAKSAGATTLAGLKGKRVAIGPAGSGSAVTSQVAFAAAGLDITKDISAQRDGFGNAASKMQDGHLDANCGVLAVPASSIVELKTTMDISYINISDAELAIIQKDYPYYTRFIIPAGTYSNEEPVETITCQAALYCRADLDEDTVYQLTKAMYEHADTVAAAHAAGRYIKVERALDGITTPLHPGAARYFKGKGLNIPAELL